MTVSEYNISKNRGSQNGGKAVKFAFISDLHDCKNEPIIEKLKQIAPNAVLVGGDFIHDADVYSRGFGFLSESASLFPTFCAIGNHERKFSGDIHAKVKETGAVLLDDRAVRFNNINIGGLSSGFSGKSEQGELKETPAPNLDFLEYFSSLHGFKLLLSHHPEYYEKYIKQYKIDLTLSGHAHGGQWRFFGRGVFAPGQGLFPKYTSGMYDGRLIVGRGLGNHIFIPRINNKREIIVINILPDESKS